MYPLHLVHGCAEVGFTENDDSCKSVDRWCGECGAATDVSVLAQSTRGKVVLVEKNPMPSVWAHACFSRTSLLGKAKEHKLSVLRKNLFVFCALILFCWRPLLQKQEKVTNKK